MFHTVRLHKIFSLYKNNCSGDRVVENFGCAIIVRKFFVSKTSLIFYLVLYIYLYIYNTAVLTKICRFGINVVKFMLTLTKLDLPTLR